MEFKQSYSEYFGCIEIIGQFWEHKDFSVFEDSISSFIEHGWKVVVLDMTRLSFVSSQGLGRIVKAYSQLHEAQGQLILLNPSGSVRETVEISGFLEFMKMFNTVEEIKAYLGVG
jgi:anti-anti-sigma factor